MKITLALVAAAISMAACTTTPPPAPPKPDDESAALLSSALKRAEGLPASTSSADAKARPADMGGASISINYAGEAKTLLRQVAATRGKKFSVRGPVPHLPLFVIVDIKDVTLEEFMTDVGSQFGQRADLILTDTTIEVRYRDNQ